MISRRHPPRIPPAIPPDLLPAAWFVGQSELCGRRAKGQWRRRAADQFMMTDEEYLSWVAEGGARCERALKILFERHGARLKASFRRHECSDEDAADLLQETFIRIVRAASSFRGDAKAGTWIWSIAHNCLRDHWRGRQDAISLDTMKEEDGDRWELSLGVTEPEHEHRAMQECVNRAFAAFGKRHPDNAEALRLATVEGWSMEELAQVLGRTLGATKEFLSQCRKRMRPFLERCREFLAA